jgi:hypothetical protein
MRRKEMTFLKKNLSWMTASLMVTASLFGQDHLGAVQSQTESAQNCPEATSDTANKNSNKAKAQCFKQGSEILGGETAASYNAPARIDIRGAWDVFATGSFIYWQPTQDNMDLGITNTLYAGTYGQTPNSIFNGMKSQVIDMNFSFQPGFKIGLGMNVDHDSWDVYAEYIWLHGTSSTSNTAATGNSIYMSRGVAGIIGSQGGSPFNQVSQTWGTKLDFLNLEMGRACYLGKAFTARPTFGVRGAWIREKLYEKGSNLNITGTGGNNATLSYLTVHDSTQSWAIGPRVALYSNWLVGSSFRLYGNLATDILYTQYNTVSNSNYQRANGAEAGYVTQTKVRERHLGALRNHVESELGIGWGSYFDNNNWYFDISAGYTWQVFFDQNMLRDFNHQTPGRTVNPNGNLYINGLTLSTRLDF